MKDNFKSLKKKFKTLTKEDLKKHDEVIEFLIESCAGT